VRKIAVVTSVSGRGGTTVGRALAARLGVPFHELDALFWKPGWVESTAYPVRFAGYDVVRLRSQAEIDRFLRSAE
jgi:shikimate kinase